MIKKRLFTPGPTSVPVQVLSAMSTEIPHHRSQEFKSIFNEVVGGLRFVFRTGGDVFVFASSGTGAMEAAVSNLVSPGQSAVAVVGGKFGERWAELISAYGGKVNAIDVEWGRAVKPDDVEKQLGKGERLVFVTHSETSTGALHDIEAIAEKTRKYDALLVVDAVSSLGVHDIRCDEWGLDVVVSGSQKGLMMPPGLAFASVSKRAFELSKTVYTPRYYFSFSRTKESQNKDESPFTPSISLMLGLREALSMIRNEGLENVFLRHKTIAEAVRKAVTAMGVQLFAGDPSNAVTACLPPAGIDAGKITKTMEQKFGIKIAGGQGQLKGKMFRIGHLGYYDSADLAMCMYALEETLIELGHKMKRGVGVAAFQESAGGRNA